MNDKRKTALIGTIAAAALSLFWSCTDPFQNPDKPDDPDEPAVADGTFVKGADISWVTEMENEGVKFYDASGQEKDCFVLMKELGMTAIRLRVWVNPENGYGNFCNKADVVAKAVRAKDAGMDVMIDFHYSDFFADPSRQTVPAAWAGKSVAELKTAVAEHTEDVLNALKAKDVVPKWVQVGNETRNGMLWGSGQLWNSTGDIAGGWQNYAGLSNAGYDAVKSVFPDAQVIVHQNNAWEDLDWWFERFRNAGGKFDMIGLSHYPQSESDKAWTSVNKLALSHIGTLGTKYGCKVMVCETGVKTNVNESTAALALKEFMTEARKLEQCAGVFYWEPQVNITWKPSYYESLGWNAYDMGAFSRDCRPTSVLDCFKD